MAFTDATPVPAAEAFEERGRDAMLSQAAVVLAAGAAVGGRAGTIEPAEALGLPELAPLERTRRVSLEQAVAPLDVSVTEHVEQIELRIPAQASTPIARRLVDHPEPVVAATLVEANLHSPHRLVRTSAAVAALDTTGPRPDIVEHLAEGARDRDPLVRDLGRTGLARVEPGHEALRNVVGRPAPLVGSRQSPHTSVVTHGTFASRSTWWRPGGEFHDYLENLQPSMFPHDPSFQWTGLYSHEARDVDAANLVAWVADQALNAPDFFGHSHGATVANLATKKGLRLGRLVMLGWPVHGEWFPDFTRVSQVIDVRVRWDLVIMADRGGQVYNAPSTYRAKVKSHVNGWFDHNHPRDPDYWDKHDLPSRL